MTTSALILAGVCAAGAALLIYWHCLNDRFDVRWLIVDTQTRKVSLFKVGQFVALIISTWAFVVLVQRNLLTEWFFAGYMLTWTGASLANKWIATGGKG